MTMRISTGWRAQVLADVKTMLTGARLALFDGSQPASADATESGNVLVWITLDGGAVTAGSATNGLVFGDITTNDDDTITVLAKPAASTWKGTAIRAGTIRHGRLYAVAQVTGASDTAIRCDGQALTTEGADFVVSTQTTKVGVEVVCTELNITLSYQ